MKKKKINKNENEWKGILQDELPEGYKIVNKSPNIAEPIYNWEFGNKTIKTKENFVNFYQVGESNVSTESVTSTNVNNESVKEFQSNNQGKGYNVNDLIYKDWEEFAKDKTLSGEEEHCNVGVNKDWETFVADYDVDKLIFEAKKEPITYINSINYSKKDKRVDFEFTPFTFWQLFPSIALNLHCKEIELTWLCFGMYINYKR